VIQTIADRDRARESARNRDEQLAVARLAVVRSVALRADLCDDGARRQPVFHHVRHGASSHVTADPEPLRVGIVTWYGAATRDFLAKRRAAVRIAFRNHGDPAVTQNSAIAAAGWRRNHSAARDDASRVTRGAPVPHGGHRIARSSFGGIAARSCIPPGTAVPSSHSTPAFLMRSASPCLVSPNASHAVSSPSHGS